MSSESLAWRAYFAVRGASEAVLAMPADARSQGAAAGLWASLLALQDAVHPLVRGSRLHGGPEADARAAYEALGAARAEYMRLPAELRRGGGLDGVRRSLADAGAALGELARVGDRPGDGADPDELMEEWREAVGASHGE